YVYSDEPARLDVSGSGRSIGRPATHGKHVECLLAKSPEHDPPVAASGQASKLSADHVLQHLLVERQVSYDLLQFAILFLELTQSLHLRRHETTVLLAPIVVRGLADPGFAADLTDRCAFLALAQNEGDLRLAKLRSLHDPSSSNGPNHTCR